MRIPRDHTYRQDAETSVLHVTAKVDHRKQLEPEALDTSKAYKSLLKPRLNYAVVV